MKYRRIMRYRTRQEIRAVITERKNNKQRLLELEGELERATSLYRTRYRRDFDWDFPLDAPVSVSKLPEPIEADSATWTGR